MEECKKLLKNAGRSVTRARMTVFGVLLSSGPLSMAELTEKASGIDRASVYRAVELFERLGIVQRVNIGWKYKLELTDRFAGHHHHLTCTGCGRAIEINEAELEQTVARLAAAHDFRPTAHQIEIQGLCANCRAPIC